LKTVIISHTKPIHLLRKATCLIIVLTLSMRIGYAQKIIPKYNLYETFSNNYFLSSEIFINEHNAISLGVGYLYRPDISVVSFGKFSCKGFNGLLEYRRYIDFIDRDNSGNVGKIKGFFIGGYGRAFNIKYSYDTMSSSQNYSSKNSEDRYLYSMGIEAGYHLKYHKISFEFILGYGLWWQYKYDTRFSNSAPFSEPVDDITPWAKHHIGVDIGYVFSQEERKHKKKKKKEPVPTEEK
jgi:hypothetical protein